MATFPSINPTYGTSKRSAPNVKTIRFADGYEHRLMLGLSANQNPKVYSLTFENISESESDTLEAFLDARALDSASFDFTPPNDVQGKYVCDNWTKRIPFPNRATINVTFRQVFEPS